MICGLIAVYWIGSLGLILGILFGLLILSVGVATESLRV